LIEIDVFKGELRGNFWAHKEGEEPSGISYIGVTSKKDFPKFKKWIDKILSLIEKTAMVQDEESPWGDYSLSRVEKRLSNEPGSIKSTVELTSGCIHLNGLKCPGANESECLAKRNGLSCPTFTAEELQKIIREGK